MFYLFLFSTSSTSSSVENCPLTTMIRFLMTSSAQSTSNSPPITTGKRLGFTYKTQAINSQYKHRTDFGAITLNPPKKKNFHFYLLYVDFYVLLQTVAVQVQNQVVHKVEAVAHNDERKLVCEFGFLRRENYIH